MLGVTTSALTDVAGDHAQVMGRYLARGLCCEAWQLDEVATDESGSGRV
jgi:hypothetical protein